MADQNTRGGSPASFRRTGPVAVLVGMLALLAALFLFPDRPVSPRVAEGWAMPDATGTAISLHESPDDEWGEGYIVAGAQWTDSSGVWHDGADMPTCIGTDTSSLTRVELSVITVKSEGATWEHVVSLRCLE